MDSIQSSYQFHDQSKISEWGDELGFRIVVNTHSPLFEDIRTPLQQFSFSEDKLKIITLSDFTSEKSLSDSLDSYFANRHCQLLVIRCDAEENQNVLLLTKFLVDEKRAQYLQIRSSKDSLKHCAFIIHYRRSDINSFITPFNFLSQWKLITIDSLIQNNFNISLNNLLTKSITELLEEDIIYETNIQKVFQRVITNSFKDFKYPEDEKLQSLIKYHKFQILSQKFSDKLLMFLQSRILSYAKKFIDSDFEDNHWSVIVASDPRSIHSTSNFCKSLLNFIDERVSFLLKHIIFISEEVSSFECMLYNETVGIFEIWESISRKRLDDYFQNLPIEFPINNPKFGLLFPYSTILIDLVNKNIKGDLLDAIDTKIRGSNSEEILQETFNEMNVETKKIINTTINYFEIKVDDNWKALFSVDSHAQIVQNYGSVRELIEVKDNLEYYARDLLCIEISPFIFDQWATRNIDPADYHKLLNSTCNLLQQILFHKSMISCDKLSLLFIHCELTINQSMYSSIAKLIGYCFGSIISYDLFDRVQNLSNDPYYLINEIINEAVISLLLKPSNDEEMTIAKFMTEAGQLYHFIINTINELQDSMAKSCKSISAMLIFLISILGDINSLCKDELKVNNYLIHLTRSIHKIIISNLKKETSKYSSHPDVLEAINHIIQDLKTSKSTILAEIIALYHIFESLIELNELEIDEYELQADLSPIVAHISKIATYFTIELYDSANMEIEDEMNEIAINNQVFLLMNKSITKLIDIIHNSLPLDLNSDSNSFIMLLSNYDANSIEQNTNPIYILINESLEKAGIREGRMDSGFAIFIVNILESQHFSIIDFEEINVPKLVFSSLSILINSDQIFLKLIAIAFLKSILKNIAQMCLQEETCSYLQSLFENFSLYSYEIIPQSPVIYLIQILYHQLESIIRVKEILESNNQLYEKLKINLLPWNNDQILSNLDCAVFSGAKFQPDSPEFSLSKNFRLLLRQYNDQNKETYTNLVCNLPENPLGVYSYLSNILSFCYLPFVDNEQPNYPFSFPNYIKHIPNLPLHLGNTSVAKLAAFAVENDFNFLQYKRFSAETIVALKLSPRSDFESNVIGCLLYQIWAVIVSLGPSTPFYSILCYSADQLSSSYFPALESEDILKIISNVSDGVTTWKCNNCANIYMVGDCGKPVVTSKCACGNTIGGSGHVPEPNVTLVNKEEINIEKNSCGYFDEEIAILTASSTTVRNMSTIAYRLLHIFTLSCLAGRYLIHDGSNVFGNIKGLNNQEEVTRFNTSLFQKLTIDLNILSSFLGTKLFTTCLYVHSVLIEMLHNIEILNQSCELPQDRITILSSNQDRGVWEGAFSNYFINFDTKQMVDEFKSRCDQSFEVLQSTSLEALIDGRLNSLSKYAMESYRLQLPRLWQIRQEPKEDLFFGSYFNDPNNIKLFPLLGMALNNNQKLSLYQNLIDLYKWPVFINSNCLNQMTKQDLESFTIGMWIKSRYCKDQNSAIQLASNFVLAWNNIYSFLPINDKEERFIELCGRDSVKIPLLSTDLYSIPLKTSVMFDSDGGELRGLFFYLITKQNTFLRIAINSNCKTLQLLLHNNTIPIINFSSLQPDIHVIKWNSESLPIQYSCYSSIKGDKTNFDWQNLEIIAANSLIAQKCIIKNTGIDITKPIYYSFFLDNLNKSADLYKLSKNCKKSLNLTMIEQNRISQRVDEAFKILKNILVILVHEVNSSNEFLSKPIRIYYQECFPRNIEMINAANQIFSSSSGYNNNEIDIGSFVELYEFVEDTLAQRLVHTISSAFQVEITDLQKKELKNALNRLNLEIFIKMIRRYCFRELLNTSAVYTDVPLSTCLQPFDWPDTSLRDASPKDDGRDELDDYLTNSIPSIKNVHAVKSLEYLLSILKERKEEEQRHRTAMSVVNNARSSMTASSNITINTSKSTQQRQKKIAGMYR